MRADRLLAILLHLQTRGRVTAGVLARELEVSERTVHRDMEALGMAGVPVYAERGPHGGWMLADGYRLGPKGLRRDEVRALFLATPGTVLGDLGLDRASESALTKLLLALPAADRQYLEQVRERVLVDVTGWRASEPEDVPFLGVMRDAIWRERKLNLGYGRPDGVRVERLVDPLGLVAKGPIWYLVAATPEGDLRTYRVSRVREATLSETPSHIPPDFDLRAFWDAAKARLVSGVPRFPVRLRADPSVVSQFRTTGRWARVETVGAPEPDGWVPVEMQFELEEDACAFVLGFGPRVELLAPENLRQHVAAQAGATAALYSIDGRRAPI